MNQIKFMLKVCWFVSCSSGDKFGYDADQTKPRLCANHMHGTGSLPGTQDGAPSGQQEEVSRNIRTQRMRTLLVNNKNRYVILAFKYEGYSESNVR
jgi:hypothetical protein